MSKKLLLLLSVVLVVVPLSAQKQQLRMTLEEAIETARDQSPSALVAKHYFLASYWQFRTYKAQFLPSLNLEASLGQYNRSLLPLQNAETGEINYIKNNNLRNNLTLSIDQNIALTGGKFSVFTSLNRLDQFSPNNYALYNSQPLNINYSQPLTAYNSLKWEMKTEPKKYESARRSYLESMEDVTIAVTTLFFFFFSAQQKLEMATKNYQNTETLYKIAQERFKIGSVSKSDLLQLRLRMLNDNLAISDNQLTLETKMLSIRTYLGFNENVEIQLVIPKSGPDITLDFTEVLEKAYANSSFLLDNELLLLSAKQEVARAKATTGIQANLYAQFGLTQKGNDLALAYKNPMDQEIIGLGLSLPIIDWGLGKGKIKVAKSREEVIRTQTEQAYSQYRQDILIKVMQFNKQSFQCAVSAEADSIALQRYEITKERFINGTIGVMDINTAQSEKDQAASRYISDLSNYWKYYYNIRKLSLYDYINGKDLSAEFDKMVEK